MAGKIIRFPKKDERLQKKFLKAMDLLLESVDPAIRDHVSEYAHRLFDENPLFTFGHKIRLPPKLTKEEGQEIEKDILGMVEDVQRYYANRLADLTMQALGLYIRICQIKTVVDRP